MTDAPYLTFAELESGLDEIRRSPKDGGVLEMIVRRPQIDAREVLQEGMLDPHEGLVGDNWSTRGSFRAAEEPPNPDAQLTVMNARAIALMAQDRGRWPLAGDQLYIDMDLSSENLPPGSRLALGTAIIEVTAIPHTGCKKFAQRFGTDATKFVNSTAGKELHLRGICAKVIRVGEIRVGDSVKKI
jgi:MOSC domain-containing protein YiiM